MYSHNLITTFHITNLRLRRTCTCTPTPCFRITNQLLLLNTKHHYQKTKLAKTLLIPHIPQHPPKKEKGKGKLTSFIQKPTHTKRHRRRNDNSRNPPCSTLITNRESPRVQPPFRPRYRCLSCQSIQRLGISHSIQRFFIIRLLL